MVFENPLVMLEIFFGANLGFERVEKILGKDPFRKQVFKKQLKNNDFQEFFFVHVYGENYTPHLSKEQRIDH